jgi:hypothetical protein
MSEEPSKNEDVEEENKEPVEDLDFDISELLHKLVRRQIRDWTPEANLEIAWSCLQEILETDEDCIGLPFTRRARDLIDKALALYENPEEAKGRDDLEFVLWELNEYSLRGLDDIDLAFDDDLETKTGGFKYVTDEEQKRLQALRKTAEESLIEMVTLVKAQLARFPKPETD